MGGPVNLREKMVMPESSTGGPKVTSGEPLSTGAIGDPTPGTEEIDEPPSGTVATPGGRYDGRCGLPAPSATFNIETGACPGLRLRARTTLAAPCCGCVHLNCCPGVA
mmetsp:Transcript_19569/g.35517  ORF Transcript_19569/g.35517 Transcript_19569/m.35517 type:complete len:108 (-) Transcript_19569:1227-1550(-)